MTWRLLPRAPAPRATTLAGRGYGVRDFAAGAARVALRHVVGFDGFCLITLDPASRIPTGEVVEDALPSEATLRMTEIELHGEDVNRFDALARTGSHVAGLAEADRRETRAQQPPPRGPGGPRIRGRAARRTRGRRRRLGRPDAPAHGGPRPLLPRRQADPRRRGLAPRGGPAARRPAHDRPRTGAGSRPGCSCSRPTASSRRCNQAGEAWLAALAVDEGVPAVVGRCGPRAPPGRRPRARAERIRHLAARPGHRPRRPDRGRRRAGGPARAGGGDRGRRLRPDAA